MSNQRKFVSVSRWAEVYGVSEATARNYIARGFFPVYRIRGRRGIVIDLDESVELMKNVPRAQARGRSYGRYGKNAVVKNLVMGEAS